MNAHQTRIARRRAQRLVHGRFRWAPRWRTDSPVTVLGFGYDPRNVRVVVETPGREYTRNARVKDLRALKDRTP